MFSTYLRELSSRYLEVRAEEPNPEVTITHKRSGHLKRDCNKRKEWFMLLHAQCRWNAAPWAASDSQEADSK